MTFASHSPGERVRFNVGLIGGTLDMREGVIESIDSHGTATVKEASGERHFRDLCALDNLARK